MEDPNKIFDAKASSMQKSAPLWKTTQDYLMHAASLPKADVQRLIRDLEIRINEAKLKSQAFALTHTGMKMFMVGKGATAKPVAALGGYRGAPIKLNIKHMKRTLSRLHTIKGAAA